MILNSSAAFSSLFPDDLLLKIVELVQNSWSCMPKPTGKEIENQISLALVTAIKKEKRRVGGLPFQVHREIWQDPNISGAASYRVDIQFILGPDEEVYFAFEAKRLNVKSRRGRIQSQVGKYIRQGMYRFVDSSYSNGLPSGGMIGYVMDGQDSAAMFAINKQLRSHVSRLCMADECFSDSSLQPDNPVLKETAHTVRGARFVLHHLFLAA